MEPKDSADAEWDNIIRQRLSFGRVVWSKQDCVAPRNVDKSSNWPNSPCDLLAKEGEIQGPTANFNVSSSDPRQGEAA
jgi:hypothetical protein